MSKKYLSRHEKAMKRFDFWKEFAELLKDDSALMQRQLECARKALEFYARSTHGAKAKSALAKMNRIHRTWMAL